MENILKELYYQNNFNKNVSDEEKELIELLETNRNKLETLLNAEQKDRLERFITCYEEFYGLSCREEFVCGAKFGGKIVAEILSKDLF